MCIHNAFELISFKTLLVGLGAEKIEIIDEVKVVNLLAIALYEALCCSLMRPLDTIVLSIK